MKASAPAPKAARKATRFVVVQVRQALQHTPTTGPCSAARLTTGRMRTCARSNTPWSVAAAFALGLLPQPDTIAKDK